MGDNDQIPEYLQEKVTDRDIQTLITNEAINSRLAAIVLERRLNAALKQIEDLEAQLTEST